MKAARSQRARELAAIHVGAKFLGLDDPAYRDLLWTVARVRSARDLDEAGRTAVLEHMRARGFKMVRPRAAPPRDRGEGNRTRYSRAHYGTYKAPLMERLREQMREAGVSEQYVNGMCKRICKVDAIEFCNADHLRKLVAAMEYHLRRKRGRQ